MIIVGVSACPAGIAHTYMAQEAIEQEGRKRGHQVKVETQGSMGIENELSQEEIDAADYVVFAVSIGVEGEDRFEEKDSEDRIITVEPGDAIRHVVELFDEIERRG
ncbi:PTS fructose transporter subunit IIB [Hutsoniella sourekii]|uniref:PTS fructose transporter subunit IIB n=1 Tax=Hutsoniella sourekii TaxID=87650 RepID=UPI0004855703|nr:PTS fructose transporter subunit IIB [Hutsoniella sourekii]